MTIRTLLAAALLVLPLSAGAAEPDARAETEALIAAFQKVKQDDGKLSKADREANAKAYAELDALLDDEHFTSVSIEPRAEKFTAEQLSSFKAKFWKVVQLVAYPNSGEFLREAKVTLGKAKKAGEVWSVPLKAVLASEDLETELEFHWRQGPKGLRVVDVLFDGDSLVRDYQNQFARIVDKKGAEGLLKVLEEKRAELSGEKDAK